MEVEPGTTVRKQLLLTVHGLNSPPGGTAWQARVERLLGPHFEVRSIDYSQYCATNRRQKAGNLVRAAFDLGGRSRRSRNALEEVREKCERFTSAAPAHVIAHSFGTVLVARLLEDPVVRFDRMIFVGSPLSRHHPWESILTTDPRKFNDLRNETGWRDFVVRAAGAGSAVNSQLGLAGLRGFKSPLAHDLLEPLGECPRCRQEAEVPASIHNVPLREYDHSGLFMRRRHIERVWLPALWGIAPDVYWQLTELCETGGRFHPNSAEAEANLARLKEIRWRWIAGRNELLTFGEYAGRQLLSRLKGEELEIHDDEFEGNVEIVVEGARLALAEALAERKADKQPEHRDARALEALNPMIAVLRGVDEFMEKFVYKRGYQR